MPKIGQLVGIAGKALLALIFAWAVFYFGIYLGYGSWKHRHHQAFATHGLSLIQPAAQMNELFEACQNSISYSEPDDGPTWNAVAHFEGRYTLHLQVPVKISTATNGSTAGSPRFLLLEIESIEIRSSGGPSISYSENWKITPAQWQIVYKTGGDFSAIGIPIRKNQPVENFDTYTAKGRPSA